MERLLLVVESAHHVGAIGTILSPLLPIGAVSAPAQAEVTLKRPDGTTCAAHIRFGQVHLNLPYSLRSTQFPWRTGCALTDVCPDEVPVGTEV
jgi:hypothetical protein